MKTLKYTRPPGPAVMVRALRKSFGDHLVLDGIDLDVASPAWQRIGQLGRELLK